MLVGLDGKPQKVELQSSSGSERFDKASIDAANGWRYVPGKRNGVPEPMWLEVPVTFRSGPARSAP
ncbi:energy transducer TonB [Variovorax boronicumulans]|uniref:energy transducer TonB n=1 Tax=Variovorax boronicumulans TaxID=436515 RepID=UPI00214C046A